MLHPEQWAVWGGAGAVSALALLRRASSAVLVGIAIKWMDDLIDEPGPSEQIVGLSPGAQASYALAALALGASLDTPWALSLFAAAYAVGMLSTWDSRLPSGLTAWIESVAAVLLSVVFFGWAQTLGSLAMMVAVQGFDDAADMEDDRLAGRPNWALRLGRWETLGLGLTALMLTAIVEPSKAALVMAATPCALWVVGRCSTRQEGVAGDPSGGDSGLGSVFCPPGGLRHRSATRQGGGVHGRDPLRSP